MEQTTFFDFIREVRTPHSEVYSIFTDEDESCQGRVDLHFGPNGKVFGNLCVFTERTDEEIQALLAAVDDHIVNTADLEDETFQCDVHSVSQIRGFNKEES